jgi:hypothetical protein
MSDQTKADKSRGKLDRWGMRPAPAGVVRGKAGNIRRQKREAAFGEMEILDFELFVAEGEPTVAVRMEGNDFSNNLWEGVLTDVRDPDPKIRPIVARRIHFPYGDGQKGEMISYYPGRDDPSRSADRNWTILTIAGPILFGLGVALLIFWYFKR